jgi:hypothetical protein
MTMEEVAYRTPNGLHDAYLLGLSVDYKERVLRFDLNWWTGDLSSDIEEVRESWRQGALVIQGFLYLVIESPGEGGAGDEPSYIDGCATRESDIARALLPSIPDNCFRYSIFVGDWNSLIHFAGTSAKVDPNDLIVREMRA